MKKLVLFFIGAALVGCAKDSTNPAAGEGEITGMTLRMVFPRSGEETRATSDTNAIDAEAQIKSVDVYIYTQDGSYLSRKTLAPGDFQAVTPAPAGRFDAYETMQPIVTTTGPKNIYVGVNLPSSVASSLENQALQLAASFVQVIPRSSINLAAGLPMFSTEPSGSVLVKDAAQNTIIANVQRIVAKVTVETDPNIDNTTGVPGKLAPLQFAINNQNTKFFLQQSDAPLYKDPNWAATSYNLADFAAATASDYVDVSTGPQSIGNYHAQYAVENTSEDHTAKTLTRVTVRSRFIPNNIASTYTAGSGTTPTQSPNPNIGTTTYATFWTVTPNVSTGTIYFDNAQAAINYATDNNVKEKEYANGYCYWNIFLNLDAVGDVVRNDFYKCNITRIVAPGTPDDQLTNPDSKPDMDTSMMVEVNILYWNTPVLKDYELVP